MTIPLRQSTASQEIPLGYLLDSTDGDSEETGLTIANTDIKLWKHGATTLANKNSGGATHISNGIYYCVLDATDTATLGGMIVYVHVAGALAIKVDCEVMTANRYDSLVAGTDTLEVDVTLLDGDSQSATDLSDFVDTGYDPSTHKVQGVVLTDTTTTNTDMVGTDNAALAATALTDVMWTDAKAGALTDWINGGRLDLILDIIAADTTTDIPAILNNADYGLAHLLRSTTPTNTLDVAATGEAGLDFANIKDATGAHTLTNITVPVTTAVTNEVSADAVKISGDTTAANNLESQYDTTGLAGDTFPATQAQIGNISSGTAATNTTADSATVTTGSETNTYADTAALDGTSHVLSAVGNVIDFYYEFDVGANGVPSGVLWEGYAASQGDTYAIYAWNWTGTPAWEQIGTKSGVNGTSIVAEAYSLTTAHVGTGADDGKVRVRIQSSDGTAYGTDRILCSFATVYRSAGYSDGAIWVDTNNGSAGTVDYVNGTSDNPCSTWAAAKTLSASLGIKKFNIVNGSSVTMDASCDNFTFVGYDYTLALGGQSFENAHIYEAHVSGTGTAGSGAIHFHTCCVGAVSLGKSHFHNCGFDNTVTATAATTYIFDNCFNSADGSAAPVFDFGAAVGNTHVGGRNWHGGVEIANLGATGTDVFSITGAGSLIIASTCSAGTIKVAGLFTITDNVGGGFSGTLTEDARYDAGQINDEVADILKTDTTAEMSAGAPPASPTIEQMINYLYRLFRNKSLTTSSLLTIRNDADTADLFKSTISDDNVTFTKEEYVTG